MTRAPPDRPRVLLIWPGGLFGGNASFGVPGLLLLAAALRGKTDAIVEVRDLDMERALGPVDLASLARPGWDLVGISCYSSYDYLKVMAIATRLRALLPEAWLVSGGYHASACPDDLLGEGSPFDFVVIGDGEGPLARLVSELSRGRRPTERILGPEPVPELRELAPYDWSLLSRYRPVARNVASQAEIYLSRGCPYGCSFCMERAKRDVSWRALDPEQAVEELSRLDAFLDLSRWTLFVADALFGMKRDWRRAFLEALARAPLRACKIWLLIRLDLIEKEDIALMARANVAPGFGLESGDPDQLRRIRKSGHAQSYLEKMLALAEWARDYDVPFGANIIVGHPGETEASLRSSAAYMQKLFVDGPRGTQGFLSVDPFRLYPGSPIAEQREDWQRQTGMRLHRYPWWHDGDQDFLAEWVDPSFDLDFRRCHELRQELFAPIVHAVQRRFAYAGPARDYFLRAVDEQVELLAPRPRLRTLGLYHLWRGLSGELGPADRVRAVAEDRELAETARQARAECISRRKISAPEPLMRALVDIPRERFVPTEHIIDSAEDRPLPLSEDGGSTISALHAYAVAFQALGLGSGDALVDLGGGTGYGAALAAEVVGPGGSVLTIEIEPDLARQARSNLSGHGQVRAVEADAHQVELWRGARKVFCGFALKEVPRSWIDALAPGGILVAPVGEARAQELVRHVREADGLRTERIGRVIYVLDRTVTQ